MKAILVHGFGFLVDYPNKIPLHLLGNAKTRNGTEPIGASANYKISQFPFLY